MDQPDIIFILVDDLGARDLGCYGSRFYETPHLDRLASEGMLFTDAYAAAPICSPTRASLLTGKYPATLGITDWIGARSEGRLMCVPYLDHLPETETTVAAALRDGGYQTWHIGKWHLGEQSAWPEHRGFDINLGGCGWGHPRHGHFAPWGLPNLSEGPPGEYLADRLTDEAIRLMQSRGDQPFFLNLWYYAVHTPVQAPEVLVEKYRRKARDMGLDQLPAFREGEHFPCLHKQGERVMRRLIQSDATYAAMIENLDSNVGRLLSAVERAGRAGNSLIVLTSDNGGLSTAEGSPTCNLPLAEGKGWMYEGGTRVPQIIRWPGVITPGLRCGQPVTSPDFYPTLLNAAGLAPLPLQHTDGVSLRPTFENRQLDRKAIFWHYPHYSNQGGTPACAMRSGDWKLIEFFETGKLELYNLREDLEEKRNVVRVYPAIAESLGVMLRTWRQSVGAVIPRPNRAIGPLHSDQVDGPEV